MEDSPTDVMLLRLALEEHGIQASMFVVNDGEEALRVLARIEADEIACPDLLILDINLPRVDGLSVLRQARAGAKCGQKPIVMFSSSDAQRDQMEAARLGATCYIQKPSDLDSFMAVGATLKELLSCVRAETQIPARTLQLTSSSRSS